MVFHLPFYSFLLTPLKLFEESKGKNNYRASDVTHVCSWLQCNYDINNIMTVSLYYVTNQTN